MEVINKSPYLVITKGSDNNGCLGENILFVSNCDDTYVSKITVDKNGLIFFNDKEVLINELSTELISFDTKDVPKTEFPISLEADENVTNGVIVKLFDVIRESGFSAINLRTTTKK